MDSTPLLAVSYPRQPARTARLRAFRQWLQNARTRRQLAALDSRQLADIGISPSERMREISKPFWR
ncbi:hypothetical protein H681_00550 [Pseudomonas sp. ATCC 13867]|uniref:DUF1127 domain-containing protein n=1 Tax=Pseudomonas sp. ATCC 13867 TaxID=1294143 RepID=UPI0002C4F12F|nr:DUF1127 domain-containing protein [Pseudomonas sp. ATCC 13867]AGI21992.1 hypothetical protein H681_00550 [Pseudomonas sp. ATCC 13867]RFQ29469.1 DUF1127 domain-containing protein [Pseudomonas sp. ATCC 13867]